MSKGAGAEIQLHLAWSLRGSSENLLSLVSLSLEGGNFESSKPCQHAPLGKKLQLTVSAVSLYFQQGTESSTLETMKSGVVFSDPMTDRRGGG